MNESERLFSGTSYVCRDTVYTDFVSVITCEARRGPQSTSTCMEPRLLQELALD